MDINFVGVLILAACVLVPYLMTKSKKKSREDYTSAYNIVWKSPSFPLNSQVKLLPNVVGLTIQARYQLVNTVGTVVRGETIVSGAEDEKEMKTRTPVDFSGNTHFIKPLSLERAT